MVEQRPGDAARAIAIRGLRKAYPGGVVAIRGLDLDISSGIFGAEKNRSRARGIALMCRLINTRWHGRGRRGWATRCTRGW